MLWFNPSQQQVPSRLWLTHLSPLQWDGEENLKNKELKIMMIIIITVRGAITKRRETQERESDEWWTWPLLSTCQPMPSLACSWTGTSQPTPPQFIHWTRCSMPANIPLATWGQLSWLCPLSNSDASPWWQSRRNWSPWLKLSTTEQLKRQCGINIILIGRPAHNTVATMRKKIN